jgi:Uma2 family endonuclease
MNNLARATRRMTPQEYFAFEETTPLKHEYLDGAIYAMVGATDRHNLIALNIATILHASRPAGCQPFISDMKLRVRLMAGEFYYYPDILVSRAATDRDPLVREQPVLLIEVSSPPTERTDRGEKLNAYTQILSLVEYMIVAQDRREVEIFRRRDGWVCETLKSDSALVLDSVGPSLASAKIYADFGF